MKLLLYLLTVVTLQAGWLAQRGIQNATNENLQQSLDAMQTNFDTFLHATQAAGNGPLLQLQPLYVAPCVT